LSGGPALDLGGLDKAVEALDQTAGDLPVARCRDPTNNQAHRIGNGAQWIKKSILHLWNLAAEWKSTAFSTPVGFGESNGR
jgi:hypothetical protein